jgi:hypothetical protein
MNHNASMFLDNTRKDLIGGTTAVVLISGFLKSNPREDTLDRGVTEMLSECRQSLHTFVSTVVSLAHTADLMSEVIATIEDLVPPTSGHYSRKTVNALLSLYAGQKTLTNWWGQSGLNFHLCLRLLQKKLRDLVSALLWCRVEAYERGEIPAPLDLSRLYCSAVSLVPNGFVTEMEEPLPFVRAATTEWKESEITQKGIKITEGTDSGLAQVLSEIEHCNDGSA